MHTHNFSVRFSFALFMNNSFFSFQTKICYNNNNQLGCVYRHTKCSWVLCSDVEYHTVSALRTLCTYFKLYGLHSFTHIFVRRFYFSLHFASLFGACIPSALACRVNKQFRLNLIDVCFVFYLLWKCPIICRSFRWNFNGIAIESIANFLACLI